MADQRMTRLPIELAKTLKSEGAKLDMSIGEFILFLFNFWKKNKNNKSL